MILTNVLLFWIMHVSTRVKFVVNFICNVPIYLHSRFNSPDVLLGPLQMIKSPVSEAILLRMQ